MEHRAFACRKSRPRRTFGKQVAAYYRIKQSLSEVFMNRKKKTSCARFLVLLVLVSGMVLLSAQLYGQQAAPSQQQSAQRPGQGPGQPQQPGQTPDQSGQAPDSQAQSQQSGVQVFTGTIVKSGDKYVLQDSDSNTTYDIDAQDQVKQFEGKKVRVHGTLDPNGKLIHVQ
jgi:hypothetical protein